MKRSVLILPHKRRKHDRFDNASKREARSTNAGFTLIEFLVVLVIIGPAASLNPGFVSGRGSSTALDHAARTVAASLRDVR